MAHGNVDPNQPESLSVITRRLSVPELSQRILEMAQSGVYRESVLECLQPMATKKQIREAIAHAKRFGLHSVASLRDAELGTYYQVDLVKYQSLQHAIATPAHLGTDADLIQRLTDTTQALTHMLAAAKIMTVMLVTSGIICVLTGREWAGFGFLSSGLSTTSIWFLQKIVARKVAS